MSLFLNCRVGSELQGRLHLVATGDQVVGCHHPPDRSQQKFVPRARRATTGRFVQVLCSSIAPARLLVRHILHRYFKKNSTTSKTSSETYPDESHRALRNGNRRPVSLSMPKEKLVSSQRLQYPLLKEYTLKSVKGSNSTAAFWAVQARLFDDIAVNSDA